MKRIAFLGEFDPGRETHIATVQAIEHSAEALGIEVEATWVSTAEITGDLFRRYHAIWITPGGTYLNQQKLFGAIRHARENGVPCIGTCGGFQHIILEYARHELGFPDAQSEEYDPRSSHIFISLLACSLRGREFKLTFTPGSLVEQLYGTREAIERYYCGFGVNPGYVETLRSGPMRVTGEDPDGEIRVVEWPAHPFFLGTLYVPQARSLPGQPHPVLTGFLSAL